MTARVQDQLVDVDAVQAPAAGRRVFARRVFALSGASLTRNSCLRWPPASRHGADSPAFHTKRYGADQVLRVVVGLRREWAVPCGAGRG